jgi:hypothetical protein
MIMFLDKSVDHARVALATKFKICMVVESEAGSFRLLNPEVKPTLKSIFDNDK